LVREQKLANKRNKDENNVENEASRSSGKKMSDRMDGNHNRPHRNRREQLQSDDGINLANEAPPKLGALQHHWIQRPRSGLHIILPVRLIPHHHFSKIRRINV